MQILTTRETVAFNRDAVKSSGFIRARYRTWKDFRNGLVTAVDEKFLTVLFQTGANASTSYFKIRASEAADGFWQIIFSNDMETFYRTEDDSHDDGTN